MPTGQQPGNQKVAVGYVCNSRGEPPRHPLIVVRIARAFCSLQLQAGNGELNHVFILGIATIIEIDFGRRTEAVQQRTSGVVAATRHHDAYGSTLRGKATDH